MIVGIAFQSLVAGASSVARAWSGYVDFLANGSISAWLNNNLGNWQVSGLAQYPDLLAVAMTMFLSLVCAIGVRESTMMNNVLTAVNVCVILFVIIAGSFYTHVENFSDFAPFGVGGIFQGAATAFFSYVGFDVIATSAEETINPSKSIPIAIIVSLCLCMVCYMGVSAVITLMVNYTQIDETAPLAVAFQANNVNWAKYIIAIGAICGLSTSLMTSIFPMPRIVYAISADGLLPKWIGRVHPWFNTPLNATMLCGALAAFLAMIFDLYALADMMSVGTLLSYTLVAASVLVLRYRQYDELQEDLHADADSRPLINEPLIPASACENLKGTWLVPRILADRSVGMWQSKWSSYAAAGTQLCIYVFGCVLISIGLVVQQSYNLSDSQNTGLYALVVVGALLCFYSMIFMYRLPRTLPSAIAFTTPFVPMLPLVSIFVNIYLLASLSPFTWVRFAVWCVIGSGIYLFYGIKHSVAPIVSDSASIDSSTVKPAFSRPADERGSYGRIDAHGE
jgi:amino acid transporter